MRSSLPAHPPVHAAPSHRAVPAVRVRGAEAFRPRSIEAYALPGDEVLGLNKAIWRLEAGDAVLLIHDLQNH
ncbi:MAG: hypothetical protein ACK5Y8_14580, partial [Betaproteobacteria bacterium]